MTTLGIVFPGQGSQSVGMLADIAQQFSEVAQVFSECSEALGYDLWKVVQAGPREIIDQTVYTQPALLASAYAIWKILHPRIGSPAVLAGHSLGEYTALLCANALTLSDAIRLVAIRGKLMQEAVPMGAGGLAAIIGLDHEMVNTLCKQSKIAQEVVAPANYNCPGQVVISGHLTALERVITLAKAQGARMAKLLPVSVPSHSLLMKTAADKLAEVLASIPLQDPKIPIVNNVDVQVYDGVASIRDGLVRQLYMPVRWEETIQWFVQQGITMIVECGPGKVLTGLNKRITDIPLTGVGDLANLHAYLTSFKN